MDDKKKLTDDELNMVAGGCYRDEDYYKCNNPDDWYDSEGNLVIELPPPPSSYEAPPLPKYSPPDTTGWAH